KIPNSYSSNLFVHTDTLKFNKHFIFHDAATPNVVNANSSFSSKRTILNNPDISNKRSIGGLTEQTTISPPSCNTSLYLPSTTPRPELSINETNSRFNMTCFIEFVYIISFHLSRNNSASW